jgi:hypothetical protein
LKRVDSFEEVKQKRRNQMANQEHVDLLKQGVEQWNKWREHKFQEVRPNLVAADLRGANLNAANLKGANLVAALLRRADLIATDLRGADLQGAHLEGADLSAANLGSTRLDGANLRYTILWETTFANTDLSTHIPQFGKRFF